MMTNLNNSSFNTERRSNINNSLDSNSFFARALNLLIGIGGVILEIFLIHIASVNYGQAWLWAYIPGTIIIIFLLGIVDRYTQ